MVKKAGNRKLSKTGISLGLSWAIIWFSGLALASAYPNTFIGKIASTNFGFFSYTFGLTIILAIAGLLLERNNFSLFTENN